MIKLFKKLQIENYYLNLINDIYEQPTVLIMQRYISYKLWYRAWRSTLTTSVQYWKEIHNQCNMSRIINNIYKDWKERSNLFAHYLTVYTRKIKKNPDYM